jgi:hypothetical protein
MREASRLNTPAYLREASVSNEEHFIKLTAEDCNYKTFTVVIFVLSSYAKVFATVGHFHLSLLFSGKTGAYQSGAAD